MMKMSKVLAVPVAAALVFSAAAAGAGTTVSLAYRHTSGDYGLDQDTDTRVISLEVSHAAGPWEIGLGVPWVRVSGFGTVVVTGRGTMAMSSTPWQGMYSMRGSGRYGMGGGTGADATATTSTARVTESGIGDVSAFLGYGFGLPGGLDATVTGTVKFATGDEDKGLGTGGTDYGLELGLERQFGAVVPFVTAGYVVTGDNGAISYDDYPYLSIGADYAVTPRFSAGIAWNYAAAVSDDTDAASDITADLSVAVDRTWSVKASAGAGLSDSSPDTIWGLALNAVF